jgi:hypothetical protein
MEREIEKPEINIDKTIERKEVRTESPSSEKEIKGEDIEEKKKIIEEALSEVKEQKESIISPLEQDSVVSKLIKMALAEGPESIRGELDKIKDPYTLDQVHDGIMKALNK